MECCKDNVHDFTPMKTLFQILHKVGYQSLRVDYNDVNGIQYTSEKECLFHSLENCVEFKKIV